MGKGGGSPPTHTSSDITQTDLPEYAKPFYLDMMNRAQGESNRAYTPYGGQRVADFTSLQRSAQDATGRLQRPDQFRGATELAGAAGLGALNAGANWQSGAYDPQFSAHDYQTGSWTQPGTAEQFMSPYMQNAVDVQKQEAIRDAQKGMLAQNLGASRQGTYGGSRQLLAGTERERNLGDELSQIQAAGTQAAYDRGQSAFEQEQGRRLQTQQLGDQSRQFQEGAQQFGAQFGEQSKQFGADLAQRGYGQALGAAGQLGQLGTSMQQSDLQRLQAQATAGAEIQAKNQQYMDTAYGDFLRQRDYPKEQLNFFNAQLRGLPMQLSSTQTSYGQPPSALSQLGGAGLAGLGVYNLTKNVN